MFKAGLESWPKGGLYQEPWDPEGPVNLAWSSTSQLGQLSGQKHRGSGHLWVGFSDFHSVLALEEGGTVWKKVIQGHVGFPGGWAPQPQPAQRPPSAADFLCAFTLGMPLYRPQWGALSPRGLHPLPVTGHLCSPVYLEVKGATGLLSGVVRKIQQDVVLTVRTLTC